VLIRTRVSEIREMGRATQGVTLISLDDGTKLSGLQHIAEAEAAVDLDADLDGGMEEAGDVIDGPDAPSADGAGDAGDDAAGPSEGDDDNTV
jgi:DNA gyrase subunit A